MEKHQEQLAKNANVNSTESTQTLQGDIWKYKKKNQPKPLCHFMYFWKYAIIYEKIVPVEKSVKRASNKWAFFLLSTSIICISFCHLAAKSPVMGYICWCMLYAAFLLPLPLSYAESQANIHYSIPSLLLTSQLSAEWSHENQARTPGSRQSMITCTLCLSN